MPDTEERVVVPVTDFDFDLIVPDEDDEEEFQPAPYVGALSFAQIEWFARETTNRQTGFKETKNVEQLHYASMPEDFEVRGLGFHGFVDLPARIEVTETDEATGNEVTVLKRAAVKNNSKLGKFIRGITDTFGPSNPRTGKTWSVFDLEAGDLRGLWQKQSMTFGKDPKTGKRIKSKPTPVLIGPAPDAAAMGQGDLSPADLALALSIYDGKNDREFQKALETSELPKALFDGLMSGAVRKQLMDSGSLRKDADTKRYAVAAD